MAEKAEVRKQRRSMPLSTNDGAWRHADCGGVRAELRGGAPRATGVTGNLPSNWYSSYLMSQLVTHGTLQESLLTAMTERLTPLQHIERALTELDEVQGNLAARDEIPFYGPTMLASMTEMDQALAVRAEQARYEAQPEASALHFCVTSAIALLEVSQVLLNQKADPSPADRERQWKTLIAYTKTAGRSAYRAASILTDQKDY